MSRLIVAEKSLNPTSSSINSDSASRSDQPSSTDREGAVCSDKITAKYTVITKTPHFRTLTPPGYTFQNNNNTETKGGITDDSTKYSSSVDPQVAKSDEHRREGNIDNKAAAPHSTSVDPDNYSAKPDKQNNQKDARFDEVDTPATITADVNNPEQFNIATPLLQQPKGNSMAETVHPYAADIPQNPTLANEPPFSPEITKNTDLPDTAHSNVSIDEDKEQQHHQQHPEEEEQMAVQDQAAMQIRRTPMPTPPTTDHDGLCIGISRSKVVAPPHDSSTVTVLWVHPMSPLKDVYTIDGMAELPTLGQLIGGGGNAPVYVCSVTTSSGEMIFACKVEQKKPLYNSNIFKKVCQLEDSEHFVIVHAYLKEMNKECTGNQTGYLLMEYFPLKAVGSALCEFSELESCGKKIKEIQDKMKESKTNSEFGEYRTKWQTVQRKQEKLTNCCYRLVCSIIESLKLFHEQNLVHLDIKEYNILLRKTCEHKDKLICDCDSPPFNVLIGDFDYCHEVDDGVSKPRTTGTKGYQTFSMRNNRVKQVAKPTLDLFGLLVTIIKVRSTMGHKQECCKAILKAWDEIIITIGELETEQSKVKENLEKLESCKQPDFENDFDEDNGGCARCIALQERIALAASQLKRIHDKGINLVTMKLWKHSRLIFESFLYYAFSDINDSKLDDLIASIPDILNDYQTTIKNKNQVS